MSFPQHTLDYLLVSLKIIGIIGAFAGLATGEGKSESAKPKKRTVYALMFLFMAVGAEICDSSLKIHEGQEQAERFNRLAHPLGTIRTVLFYNISLNNPLLESYRKRVLKEGLVEPRRNSEPEALALLEDAPDVTVFIYKQNEKNRKKDEPDLSFDVKFWNRYAPLPKVTRTNFKSIVESRHYEFIDEASAEFFGSSSFYPIGTVAAQVEDENHSDDRYSNGEIVSDRDLLGATIVTRFCRSIVPIKQTPSNLPMKADEDPNLDKLLTLQEVRLEFPGRQVLGIGPATQSTTTQETNGCTYFYFKIPKDGAKYRALLQK